MLRPSILPRKYIPSFCLHSRLVFRRIFKNETKTIKFIYTIRNDISEGNLRKHAYLFAVVNY